MMELGVAAIDHLMTFVPSLDAAAEQFERMGFRLSPISRIDAMGISNRMILMQPRGPGRANFIELMSPHDPVQLPPSMATILTGVAGSRSLVLASNDISTLFDRIRDCGFSPSPLIHVKREWEIADEPSVFPEFDVILPFESPFPFNACQYYNAHLYSRPDWLDHPNSAIRVATILAVSDDVEDTSFFEQILGRKRRHTSLDEILYPSSEIDLFVMSNAVARKRFNLPHGLKLPKYIGYEVSVASLTQLKHSLNSGHILWSQSGGGVVIAAEHGLGNIILFREQL